MNEGRANEERRREGERGFKRVKSTAHMGESCHGANKHEVKTEENSFADSTEQTQLLEIYIF